MAERFDVVEQLTTVGPKDDGTYGDVVKVTFRAKPSGAVDWVYVPVAAYAADEVARRILERIDRHEAVKNL